MSAVPGGGACRVCGETNGLSRCSRCHKVTYCSKAHQTQDWKVHKKTCQPVEILKNVKNLKLQDSSKKVNQSDASKEASTPSNSSTSNGTDQNRKLIQQTPQWSASNSVRLESYLSEDVTDADNKRAATVLKSLQEHGLIILNNFLPKDQAEMVRKAIVSIYSVPENFIDGEIVKQGSNLGSERVRGDRIRWVDENYTGCAALRIMCKRMDKLVQLCSKIGSWNIEARTKPMVACYPGDGACYKRHVDNPAEDGRRLTCLYYINENWDAETDGGCLCIYPQVGGRNCKVLCEPLFNRICIFFSDSRNPHEVFATYKQRFAVTCWYFDRDERQRALQQWAEKAKAAGASSTS